MRSREGSLAGQALAATAAPCAARCGLRVTYRREEKGEGLALRPGPVACALRGQGKCPQPRFFLGQQAHESLQTFMAHRCSLSSSLLYMTRGAAETTVPLIASWNLK